MDECKTRGKQAIMRPARSPLANFLPDHGTLESVETLWMVTKFDERASKAFEDYAAAAQKAQRTLNLGDGIRAGRLWGRYLSIAAQKWVDDPKIVQLHSPRRTRQRPIRKK